MFTVLMLSEWIPTFALVFGGCCSNALTLEQLTSSYPHSGSLITFIQFLLISLHGLPKHVSLSSSTKRTFPIPFLNPPKIPIKSYLLQVALFYFVSLLNNTAFAYQIPMAVHIIFRSGGLIVSMILGWLVAGKRYTTVQIFSVFLVMLGVFLTTLFASTPNLDPAPPSSATNIHAYTYSTGIAILSLALLLSGFLGIVQDMTYAQYGDVHSAHQKHSQNGPFKKTPPKERELPPWQESMFYLHFLALPMFLFLRNDLSTQFKVINSGPLTYFTLPQFLSIFPSLVPFKTHPDTHTFSLAFPKAYIPLLLNTLTQLLCVAGVHCLTTRVSSLTVTLVLAVRKAASLVISVVWLRTAESGDHGRLRMMWIGATLVMVGTVGYSVGSTNHVEIGNGHGSGAVDDSKGKLD